MMKTQKATVFLGLGVVIFLSVLIIILVQIATGQEQQSQSRLDERVEILNTQFFKASNALKSAVNMKSQSQATRVLQDIVLERSQTMLALMEADPTTANNLALKESSVVGLSSAFLNRIEKQIEVEGILEVLHHDDFEKGISKTQFFLMDNEGREYKVYFPPTSLPLVSNSKIRIKGVELEGNIAAASEEDGGTTVLSAATLAQAPTAKNVAVILINFLNDTGTPWTASQVSDAVFNQTDSYYNENSFGKLDIIGDIFGYYTLPINDTCNTYSIMQEGIKAADADVYFPDYTNIVFAGPFSGCGSFGTIGEWTVTTADGTSRAGIVWANSVSVSVVGHEFGHNFGSSHANFYNCGADSLRSSGCSSEEYDDLFDIMGRGGVVHMNAYHKELLNFFDTANVVNVTSSGSYTISPIENASTVPQILKISNGAIGSKFTYIEYRQPVGLDSKFLPSVVDGAMIRIAPWYTSGGDSQLLDTSPSLPRSHNNVTLGIGETFIQPGIASITVSGVTPSSLTMDINLLSPLVDVKANGSDNPVSLTAPAKYFVSWSFSGADITCDKSGSWSGALNSNGSQFFDEVITSGIYTYTITCSNTAGSTSDSVTVTVVEPTEAPIVDVKVDTQDGPITYAVPATFNVYWSANYATLGCENSSDWAGFDYSYYAEHFTSMPAGAYTYTVTCSNNIGTTSDNVIVYVVEPDIISPTSAIISPSEGEIVSDTVTISATARDDVGVASVSFFVDEVLLGIDMSEPYFFPWDTTTALNGSYILKSLVTDTSGNTGESAPVSVNVSNMSFDTISPSVSITNPANGSSIARRSTVTIAASASDNVGVTKVEFYINGSIICTDAVSPYNCVWKVPNKRNAGYTIQAKAYDAMGNSFTDSVSVTAK